MAKVGVLGARGRMGREVVRTVTEAPDLEVSAEVDQGDALDALTGCDVVVDFTHPGVVMSNLHWCVLHDVDAVVGTSGFGEDRLDEVLAICRDEIARVVEEGLSDAELIRGKGQVRGSIVLSLEDPSSRMSRLGKSELVYPRLEPVDEVLSAIDSVGHDDIRAIAADILTRPKTLAVVGPFDDASAFQA